jgi:hypothetical protein
MRWAYARNHPAPRHRYGKPYCCNEQGEMMSVERLSASAIRVTAPLFAREDAVEAVANVNWHCNEQPRPNL